MPVTLAKFVDRVADFRDLPDSQKIKHLIWYAHTAQGQERITTGDVRILYDTLHLVKPNISENLTRLYERKILLKDSRGYYMEGGNRAALDSDYLSFVQDSPIEVGDDIIPIAMIQGTRPHLERLAWQVNGSYQYKFYDGCAVLMRRMVESLLIEVFVKAGHVDKIRTGTEFMMLAGIISITKNRQYVQLARGSDQILEDVKYIGDRSAHNRTYLSTQNDVKDIIPRFRTVIGELLHLADIHPRAL